MLLWQGKEAVNHQAYLIDRCVIRAAGGRDEASPREIGSRWERGEGSVFPVFLQCQKEAT